jgi:hypothetical protein
MHPDDLRQPGAQPALRRILAGTGIPHADNIDPPTGTGGSNRTTRSSCSSRRAGTTAIMSESL